MNNKFYIVLLACFVLIGSILALAQDSGGTGTIPRGSGEDGEGQGGEGLEGEEGIDKIPGIVQKQLALLRAGGVFVKIAIAPNIAVGASAATINCEEAQDTLLKCVALTYIADPMATDPFAACRDSEFDLVGKPAYMLAAQCPQESDELAEAIQKVREAIDCDATLRHLQDCARLSDYGLNACGPQAQDLTFKFAQHCSNDVEQLVEVVR
ncbi:hypothetical protein GF342_04620 [Candidatus Woesearchaeota archaeon]|nr:hypothetical protein [Candidatus Woesearchaeota archaeon]